MSDFDVYHRQEPDDKWSLLFVPKSVCLIYDDFDGLGCA
mgnify:CR=1 FL=1